MTFCGVPDHSAGSNVLGNKIEHVGNTCPDSGEKTISISKLSVLQYAGSPTLENRRGRGTGCQPHILQNVVENGVV